MMAETDEFIKNSVFVSLEVGAASEYGVIPEQYSKYQVYPYAAPFGEIEITLAVDETESYYIIFFTAFGDQQTLAGTLTADHIATNKYDSTGFFSSDVQSFIEGADWDAWTPVE